MSNASYEIMYGIQHEPEALHRKTELNKADHSCFVSSKDTISSDQDYAAKKLSKKVTNPSNVVAQMTHQPVYPINFQLHVNPADSERQPSHSFEQHDEEFRPKNYHRMPYIQTFAEEKMLDMISDGFKQKNAITLDNVEHKMLTQVSMQSISSCLLMILQDTFLAPWGASLRRLVNISTNLGHDSCLYLRYG